MAGFHRARWTHRVAQVLEPRALRNAAFLSAINQDYMAGPLTRYPWVRDLPNLEVQLGFSPRDHETAPSDIHPPWPSDKRVILYAGTYWEQGAPLFRELLEALAQIQNAGNLDSDLHFAFIGTGHPRLPSLQSIIEELGLTDIAQEYPERVPYLHVLAFLNQAWATLVVGSTAAHYSASKVFQLLIAGKPILAYFHPDSEGRDILEQCEADEHFSPYLSEQEDERKIQLQTTIQQLLTSTGNRSPNLAPLTQHSAASAAKKLVNTFESCL